MANDKYLFVVSGAAGTGKDSVVKALKLPVCQMVQ